MGRKKSSAFEDLIEVIALLPWWIGIALAIAAFLFLHYIATLPNPQPTDIKAMGSFAGRQLWITFALFLQYAVPVALLIGAGISAFGAVRHRRLHANVSRNPSRNSLEAMSWREFEELVGETFRRKGFLVEQRGGNGPDGGVDLVLHLGSDKYLVQCKQWKARSVGVATVRELFGVMAAEGAVGGFVVASGDFTDEASRFAEGRAIELVDTQTLLMLVTSTRPDSTAAAPSPAIPVCPKCGLRMVMRTAKRGGSQGRDFWGCQRYPDCRGTRPA